MSRGWELSERELEKLRLDSLNEDAIEAQEAKKTRRVIPSREDELPPVFSSEERSWPR